MAGVVLVQTCMEEDYTAATGTCAAPIWNPQESGFSTLTIDGAQQIGAAIAMLWAVAWIFRRLKKLLDQS